LSNTAMTSRTPSCTRLQQRPRHRRCSSRRVTVALIHLHRAREPGSDSSHRDMCSAAVVGANHAATRGKVNRLDHTRKPGDPDRRVDRLVTAPASMTAYRGCGSTAPVSRARSSRLSRVAATAATRFLRCVPNRSATAAAVRTDPSSTPTTASICQRAANSIARSADSADGGDPVSARDLPSTSQASVPRSTRHNLQSQFLAAWRNGVARYVSWAG